MNLTQFERDCPDNTIHFSFKVVFRKWDDEGENWEHESEWIKIENEHTNQQIKEMAASELKIGQEDIIEIIK